MTCLDDNPVPGRKRASRTSGAGHDRVPAEEQLYRTAPLTVTGAVGSGVAHEINNPLTAVLGFSSALLVRCKDGEEFDRRELCSYLQVIHDEALRCRDIVDHFHRFARAGGGTNVTIASLRECIDGAFGMVRTKAAQADISIENIVSADRTVLTDAVRLEQVFVCLLLNRIGCGVPGTTVTVSAPSGAETRNGRRFMEVVVSDGGSGEAGTGAGAAEDYFIFNERKDGITAGCAFCRRAVEELGGRFSCVSDAVKGTSVRLELPAAPGAQEEGDA